MLLHIMPMPCHVNIQCFCYQNRKKTFFNISVLKIILLAFTKKTSLNIMGCFNVNAYLIFVLLFYLMIFRQDLDGHLDEVELGLNNLRDLFKGTDYSVDNDTIIGVSTNTNSRRPFNFSAMDPEIYTQVNDTQSKIIYTELNECKSWLKWRAFKKTDAFLLCLSI